MDESAYLRRLIWAVDIGTDSFVLLIDMHFGDFVHEDWEFHVRR